jgi:acyl carrier protein
MDMAIATLDEVKAIVAETLDIEDRLDSMDAATQLLGGLPELDSMAVVQLLTALGERFGFDANDVEFTADVFETLGALTTFIAANSS